MKLALVIADTYPDPGIVRHVLAQCLGAHDFDECLVLSDRNLFPGTHWVPIAPMRNIRDYEAVILDLLPLESRCDQNLIVQWDGFILDGRRWEADFAGQDYIGAPWPHMGGRVGNGGFSLRSARLLRAVRDLHRPGPEDEPAEDVQICLTWRPQLEALGMRFADPGLAGRFSVETPGATGMFETFGFHGAFNFPLVMPERDILAHWPGILMRMGKAPNMWFLFIWNALVRGHLTVARGLAQHLLEASPALWNALWPALRARGVPAGLLECGPGPG